MRMSTTYVHMTVSAESDMCLLQDVKSMYEVLFKRLDEFNTEGMPIDQFGGTRLSDKWLLQPLVMSVVRGFLVLSVVVADQNKARAFWNHAERYCHVDFRSKCQRPRPLSSASDAVCAYASA